MPSTDRTDEALRAYEEYERRLNRELERQIYRPNPWVSAIGTPPPEPVQIPEPVRGSSPPPEPWWGVLATPTVDPLSSIGISLDELVTTTESEPAILDEPRAYIPRAVRNDWRTPAVVLNVVREALGGAIQLDPCASTENWMAGGDEIGEALNFHEEDDGLALDWYSKTMLETCPGVTPTAYVNPPFNGNAKWMAKCAEEAAKGMEIIALIPARTDTRYWHNTIAKTAQAVAFWRGRIKFVGATSGAPFPCALIYWGPNVRRFEEVLEAAGHHVP